MRRKRFIVLAAIPLLTLSIDASAQTGWGFGSWQAVGATGTPDEYAASRVLLRDDGWAEIRPEISTSVKLRYNIPPLEGLRGYGDYTDYQGYELRVRARDNGPLARVIVKIKSMGWWDGKVTTLAEFDSDDVLNTDETGVIHSFGPTLRDENGLMKFFRPFHATYWAEVHLIKSGTGGRPGIGAVGVLLGGS